MRVAIAPDSFGGTLSSREAAEAIARGWRQARPDDDLAVIPLGDGGEGTLDVLASEGDEMRSTEVADPLGRPHDARWLLRGTEAIIESAEACGLRHLAADERDPLRTTTYGVGQLLADAAVAGARRICVGLGGSASVDGGAGALAALGFAVVTEDGGGLKIGGGELGRVERIESRWLDPVWSEVEVVLWADVRTTVEAAAEVFGPQKGASPAAVGRLADGLARWTDVVERDLGGRWRDLPGSGAAGGLAFGLAAGLAGSIEPGAPTVAMRAGLPHALEAADAVVTGEGSLDATSGEGKVVDHVVQMAHRSGVDAYAVVGRAATGLTGLADIEESGPRGPSDRPAEDVAAAAARLARRIVPRSAR